MKYWKYRAVNGDSEVVEGVTAGGEMPAVVLDLARRGLQAAELTTISYAEYRKAKSLDRRLDRMAALCGRLGAAMESDEPHGGADAAEAARKYWLARRRRAAAPWGWLAVAVAIAAVVVAVAASAKYAAWPWPW